MSHRALNPDQFIFKKATPKEMGGTPYHRLQAIGRSGMSMGTLLWHHGTGEVGSIEVNAESRRQGVATQMWRHAQGLAEDTRGVRRPRHSPERTDLGEKWARSLGERLPRRVEAFLPQSS